MESTIYVVIEVRGVNEVGQEERVGENIGALDGVWSNELFTEAETFRGTDRKSRNRGKSMV